MRLAPVRFVEKEINWLIHIHIFLYQNKEDVLRIFMSAASHVVVVVLSNCLLLSFHIPALLLASASAGCGFLPGGMTHTFIP